MPENSLPVATSALPAGGPARECPVVFTGSTREYFGIWIVNLLLTIVTLGVWSAWAKVRRKRYFLGNTRINDRAFDYHATGGQILKGRILAVAVLLGIGLANEFEPLLGSAASIFLVIALPWFIARSLRFNARMTSWSNVRFDFAGTVGGAALAFLAWPFVGALTAGLLFPLASRAAANYQLRGHRFGTAAFTAEPPVGSFYAATAQALLVLVAIVIGATAAVGAILGLVSVQAAESEVGAFSVWHWGIVIAIVFGLPAASVFYAARVRNIVLNAASLEGGHRFRSTVSGLRLAWIVVSNFFVTVLSLGLLRPWAAVRLYNYQCNCLVVLAAGDLGSFVDVQRKAGSSFGSEYADLAGVEIGI